MRGGLLAVLCGALALACAAPASADLASLKAACEARDAAGDGSLPYVFCDDGVPSTGGTEPNEGAVSAVAVPQRYDGFAGLPAKTAPDPGAGADRNGDIALDVDVTMPDPTRHPAPATGYPLLVFMHGCCAGSKTGNEKTSVDAGGEAWHYSNAWFASRGYVVLTYTARGFVNASGDGSTGQTQLDSRRYEINDYQHLAGQLADDPFFHIDPERVVVTGGSYGGGFSWMALTDPTWTSPGGREMRVAAAAPKYGWTDLVESLVPNGIEPRATDGSTAARPLGAPKRSIIAGLYASGKTGVPPPGSHATFPAAIDEALVCLNSVDPFEANPLCGGTLERTLPEFVRDRSAFYQDEFFARVREGLRVPVFSAGTFTDPLFPGHEHRRMAERLKGEAGGAYPVQEYYGDYQHFTQNKATEWGDLCAGERVHVCERGEDDVVRLGATTRLNRFLDHYARPQANPSEPEPSFDVTASLQVCPGNASEVTPRGEPGLRFTAPSFAELAPATLRLELPGERTTTNTAAPNLHALAADPVANSLNNGGRCPVASDEAGPGVAVYDSAPLEGDVTMIGAGRALVPHSGSGGGIMVAARLYDVLPDGTALMVDRGVRTGVPPEGTTEVLLRGNGWRFERGHRIRVELAQDDEPHLRFSTQRSSLTLRGVTLELPVRETGPSVLLETPELATRSPRFAVSVTSASGERTGIARVEVQARSSRRARFGTTHTGTDPGELRFPGLYGRTYVLRARAIDHRGVPGPWAQATTVVPLDDARPARGLRYRGAWSRVRSRAAFGGRLSRSTRRGAELRLRFRGRRVDVVGRRSPRGGRALLVLDGRRRTVSFRSRRTEPRAVIASLPVRGRRMHELRLVNLGRGRVEIDALGVLDRRP
jgi:acetyl esterase/lipase